MDKTLDVLARSLTWIGGALIIGAVLVTVGDVIARRLFQTGYIGLVDVTQFAVVGFAYCAMPRAFLTNAHVSVALYDNRLSPLGDLLLKGLSLILTIGVLGMLIFYGWTQAERTLRYGDVSQNVEIPMIAFWVMILTGAGLSLVVCLLQIWRTLTGLRRLRGG